jgi:hypothetical protein
VKTADKGTHDAKADNTYQEKQIGKTLYRITSLYKGEIDLQKALEDLIVRKILREYTDE